MKVLVCGAGGQVGRALSRLSWPQGWTVVGADSRTLDITAPLQVERTLSQGWSLAINCAAYTDVDRAEAEPERAFAVNRDGAAHLARECARTDTPLIHLSTDFVFDGCQERPYRESDPVAPLNIYGTSKSAGEQAVTATWHKHVILRLSWIYSAVGRNFCKSIITAARTAEELTVLNDQIGTPTAAGDIAEAIRLVAQAATKPDCHLWGLYHLAAEGAVSRYGQAEAILAELAARGLRVPRLRAVDSSQVKAAARRPHHSVLDCNKLDAVFDTRRRPWRQALPQVIDEILSESGAEARGG